MEVFSRRSSMSPAGQSGKALPVMAPEQVQTLFRRRLSDICARFEDWQVPVTVSGTIGDVPADRWRRREGTPLLDRKTGTAILLDVSPSLLEGDGFHAGESVRVLGLLKAHMHQGQVVPRFEVLSITRDEEETLTRQRDALVQTLRDVPPQRRPFPAGEGVHMLLLGVGVGVERLRSLQQALGGVWSERNVTVRALQGAVDGTAIQLLHGAEQEIVFLVVAEERLAELEAPAFMKGLLQCPAYRVLACDLTMEGQAVPDVEAETSTVLPHLVERFFSTAAEAASFLRQESIVVRQHQDEERAHQEELAALRASLTALAERPADSPRGGMFLPLLAGLVLGGCMALVGLWMFHGL